MTIEELKSAVDELVFDEGLTEGEFFFQSLNRAIERVRMTFPKIEMREISLSYPKNILGEDNFKTYDVSGGELVFECHDGKSFYFEAEGKGVMELYWFNEKVGAETYERIAYIEVDSKNAFKSFKGISIRNHEIVKGRIKLVFKSDYVFSVRNVALYDGIISKDESDVPEFSRLVSIDLDEYLLSTLKALGKEEKISSFLELFEPIKAYVDGEFVEVEFEIAGSVLKLKREYAKRILVTYIARNDSVGNHSESSDKVDAPRRMERALSYLVASNLLLDEDEEKSRYYLALFSEHEKACQRNKTSGYTQFLSSSNWT